MRQPHQDHLVWNRSAAASWAVDHNVFDTTAIAVPTIFEAGMQAASSCRCAIRATYISMKLPARPPESDQSSRRRGADSPGWDAGGHQQGCRPQTYQQHSNMTPAASRIATAATAVPAAATAATSPHSAGLVAEIAHSRHSHYVYQRQQLGLMGQADDALLHGGRAAYI